MEVPNLLISMLGILVLAGSLTGAIGRDLVPMSEADAWAKGLWPPWTEACLPSRNADLETCKG